MSVEQNGLPLKRHWRSAMFAIVQSLLALMVVGAFVHMSVQELNINTEFGFVAGTIVGFFFESAQRNVPPRPAK